jgi:hypothetical protein
MGAKSITVGRAVTADFVFDCRAAEVLSDEWIRDVPGGVHNHAQEEYVGPLISAVDFLYPIFVLICMLIFPLEDLRFWQR